jgi:hypothetical protein
VNCVNEAACVAKDPFTSVEGRAVISDYAQRSEHVALLLYNCRSEVFLRGKKPRMALSLELDPAIVR